jgi:hypothetical protein
MKRLTCAFILTLGLLTFALPTYAQVDTAPTIAYGETAAGEITNINFDATYIFEGKAGDIVLIQMIASETADFDPYLYLTTLENTVVAQNDDYYDLNARIIARLPNDGQFQIVATRLGERTGSGEGAFTLTLEKAQTAGAGIVMEGQAVADQSAPTHVFVPEVAGIYTITYTHVRGDYYPSLIISKLPDNSSYEEDVAQISGNFMRGGSITLEVERDAIYILSLEDVYYTYSGGTAEAVYTIKVDLATE